LDDLTRPNPTWDFKDPVNKLLVLGASGGVADVERVAAERRARKPEIMECLALSKSDVVMDLGSGMGFLAEVIAPEVTRMHCCDISETYLADCRDRLKALPNVECHRTDYGDLSRLRGRGITKAYATLLFIHFHFFDLVYHLQEVNRLLEPGGMFYFDFNDGERFSFNNPADTFNDQLAIFRKYRESWTFQCMHMTSMGVLENILPQQGFEIVGRWSGPTCFSQICIRKFASLPV